jgi:hypothetical protein
MNGKHRTISRGPAARKPEWLCPYLDAVSGSGFTGNKQGRLAYRMNTVTLTFNKQFALPDFFTEDIKFRKNCQEVPYKQTPELFFLKSLSHLMLYNRPGFSKMKARKRWFSR